MALFVTGRSGMKLASSKLMFILKLCKFLQQQSNLINFDVFRMKPHKLVFKSHCIQIRLAKEFRFLSNAHGPGILFSVTFYAMLMIFIMPTDNAVVLLLVATVYGKPL